MNETVYEASPIKTKRKRRTKLEMEKFLDALVELVRPIQPATVRQVFYAATVKHLVEKMETGCDAVGRALLQLRREGRVPYPWVVDNTRAMRKPRTFNTWEDALESTAQTYRRSLWSDVDAYVEVWLEKDALSGVVYRETASWDVPLMVCRGFSSETFLYEAAEVIKGCNKPTFLYYFGDHDPSGLAIDRQIVQRLGGFAPKAEIHFRRVAVLPGQIADWSLPSRPVKPKDARARNWQGECVELDAIDPRQLRQLARECIERHISPELLTRHKQIEKAERQTLRSVLTNWRDQA